jgi:hypothetical protein
MSPGTYIARQADLSIKALCSLFDALCYLEKRLNCCLILCPKCCRPSGETPLSAIAAAFGGARSHETLND